MNPDANPGRRSNRGRRREMSGRDAVDAVYAAFWFGAIIIGGGVLFASAGLLGWGFWAAIGTGFLVWLLGGLAGLASMVIAARIPSVRRAFKGKDSRSVDITDVIVPWLMIGVAGMFVLPAIFRIRQRSVEHTNQIHSVSSIPASSFTQKP